MLALKRAANSPAHASASTIRKLIAAGFVSRRALADELNRRGIPAARGGRWHYTTVVRVLSRLGLLASGKGGRINNGQASKQDADARAKALASTIRALQAKGVVSFSAIAHLLNEQRYQPHWAAHGTQPALSNSCAAWRRAEGHGQAADIDASAVFLLVDPI